MSVNSPSKVIQQIRHVLAYIRRAMPGSPGRLQQVRKAATESVAEDWGVDERTVADACTRRLGHISIWRFDGLVGAWLWTGSPELRDCLCAHLPAARREINLRLIHRFFNDDARTEQAACEVHTVSS